MSPKKRKVARKKDSRPPSVFLCHSSKDKAFVRRLASDLSVVGVTPWFDEWELTPGDSLHSVIGHAVARAAYLSVVISPDSVGSSWCKVELNSALARELQLGRTFVLPIIYRRAKLPTFLLDKVYVDFSRGLVKKWVNEIRRRPSHRAGSLHALR